MKKIILMAAALIVAAATVSAQPRAIGARVGYGESVSYQHTLGSNMVTLDGDVLGLGLNGEFGLSAVATYDWLNPFGTSINWSPRGEWNWYLGVGAEVGDWWKTNWTVDGVAKGSESHFHVGVAGRAGLEYTFWFPLQLAVEWRPTFGPEFWSRRDKTASSDVELQNGVKFHDHGLYSGAIAVCVRYRFGM